MRKIFSLIMILCTCCALAHEYTHQFAAISASRGETDSLDVRKSKIVEELKAKKDSTTQEVVKTFIDTSIAEVNNATDSTRLDSISQLILAKVDGCLEVESKEKAATGLKDIDHQLVGKYYTDIVNAESANRVKTLVGDATTIIGLRPNKDKSIQDIKRRFDMVLITTRNPSDEKLINNLINEIDKATKQADVDKANKKAKDRLKIMEARRLIIIMISVKAEEADLSMEEMSIIDDIIEAITYCNDQKSLRNHRTLAFILLRDKGKRDAIIEIRRGIPEGLGKAGNSHFFNFVAQGGGEEALKIAIAAYNEGRANGIGTLGNQQKGPAIDLTDQDGRDIRLYNPKKTEFKEEK